MSTLNAAELGAFCEFAYVDAANATNYPAQLPAGFERLAVDANTANGFYASAFRNQVTGQIVITFRGSNDSDDWIKNNLTAFLAGQIPPQFDQALVFLNDVRTHLASDLGLVVDDSKFVLTGHSLGGALAAMVSAATGLEAATFNAPQIGGNLLQNILARPGAPEEADPTRISLYWASTDVVHSIGTQFGIASGEFQIEPPAFSDQLKAVLLGAFAAPLLNMAAGVGAILSWLAFRSHDQHAMARLLLPLQFEYGAVPVVLADGTLADASYLDGVFDFLDAGDLTEEDKTDLRQKEFDRLLLDGTPLEESGGHFQTSAANGSSRDFMAGDFGHDILTGGAGDDVIFGGSGDDVIVSGTGNDVALGGSGFDAYISRAGNGQDVVIDADGRGLVIRDSGLIVLAIRQSDTQWSFGDTTFTKVSDDDLEITFAASPADEIGIRHFDFVAAALHGCAANQ